MAEIPPLASNSDSTRATDTPTSTTPTSFWQRLLKSFFPAPPARKASFTSEAFLETVAKADRELYEAVPSREPTDDNPKPDGHALPNASCVDMLALGYMLEALFRLGVSPSQYVRGLKMSKAQEESPFMVCLRFSGDLHYVLSDAIRTHHVVNYMLPCRDWFVHQPDVDIILLSLNFSNVNILSNVIRFHTRKAFSDDKRAWMDSLPVVNIATIPRQDMRCPHCWCDFDEENKEGQDNTPVRAPCPHGHLFGKDCLKEVMCSMRDTMLCPLCRQKWILDPVWEWNATVRRLQSGRQRLQNPVAGPLLDAQIHVY
jgi:hypothetical protein